MRYKMPFLVLLGLFFSMSSFAYNVTFRVNMSEVTESFTTPEVNGTFNGFCGGCAPMTDLGGDIWELTIDLEPGIYEFKYAADTWNIQEDLVEGSSCTRTVGGFTNREFTVEASDLDLGTVCWGSCFDCGVSAPVYDVTFRVDMSEVTDPFTTPEVNGTFNGFCGGCAPMTDLGGGVWELTIPLEAGTYEYKFAADTWTIQENLVPGSPCTVTNSGFTNRFLEVVDQNIDIGTVCWAECAACGVEPDFYNVTFSVDMSEVAEPFTTPEVNGTFNGFCGGCAPMTDLGGGIWEITIQLQPGTYEYKFAADTWNIQENLTGGAPCTSTIDGFVNRSLTVVDGDINIGTVCWGSCEACSAEPLTYDVTFRVNMNEVTDAFTTPEVNGTFNGFCGGCAPMTDLGGGVWEITIPLAPGTYEYKFAADTWTIQEDLNPADPCTVTDGTFTNRFLEVVDQNIDIGTVCWGACLDCGIQPDFYDVTFRVDMSNVAEAFTTPEINGTFNGFCGGCAPMTDLGGGVWEITIPLQAGTYEYKFAADSWTIQENLTEGSPCTVTNFGFTNRFLEVVDQNIDVGTVCWGSCQDCSVVPVFYDVTFRVDMSNVAEAFATPEVNGTFNGFCGGCAPMTDLGGGVWEITIPLEAGTYEYKFAADSWSIQEEFAGGEPCTVSNSGFTNRFLEVVDQNIDIGTVCWASCEPCAAQNVPGCTYPAADNYNMDATSDDGSCIYSGCTDSGANNYNPFANNDDGSCDYTVTCAGDLNSDGVVNVSDLLVFLGAFGNACD